MEVWGAGVWLGKWRSKERQKEGQTQREGWRDYMTFNINGASLEAQSVKNLPVMQETWVQFLGWEDPLEKEMATHCGIVAWRIPWTEEPGRLQSMGSRCLSPLLIFSKLHWVGQKNSFRFYCKCNRKIPKNFLASPIKIHLYFGWK